MALRGIRGATVSAANTPDAILGASRELLEALVTANGLEPDDIASILFTVTTDLDAAFPATSVRTLGWTEVAALDAQAPVVPGDLSHCIRVLVHWNTDHSPDEIRHVYLRDARRLRPDRAGEATS